MKKNIIILVLAIFSVTLAFSQAIVRTKISSTPSDAEIYVDGSHIGHTSMEFRFRSGQMYKIELRKNNYRSQVFTYRGGSGNINKRLEALPPAKKCCIRSSTLPPPRFLRRCLRCWRLLSSVFARACCSLIFSVRGGSISSLPC